MSQPASFDMPRPGEMILACSHNTKRNRRQFFVGHTAADGKPTGLGTWLKTKDNPEGIYIRWVSLCGRCVAANEKDANKKTPIQMATRSVIWQRGAEDKP